MDVVGVRIGDEWGLVGGVWMDGVGMVGDGWGWVRKGGDGWG